MKTWCLVPWKRRCLGVLYGIRHFLKPISCIDLSTFACTYVCTYVYVFIHMYIYIYTHVCITSAILAYSTSTLGCASSYYPSSSSPKMNEDLQILAIFKRKWISQTHLQDSRFDFRQILDLRGFFSVFNNGGDGSGIDDSRLALLPCRWVKFPATQPASVRDLVKALMVAWFQGFSHL